MFAQLGGSLFGGKKTQRKSSKKSSKSKSTKRQQRQREGVKPNLTEQQQKELTARVLCDV